MNPVAIKQFLVGTILPPVVGALATWLSSTPMLAVFHITSNAAAAEITQLAVFGISAGLSWLTAHHILSGHYSPSAFGASATPTGILTVRNLTKAEAAAFKRNRGAAAKAPTKYKTGRKRVGAAWRPAGLKDFADYATAPLGQPPAEVKPPAVPYPMDGNASVGDCTIAGCDHLSRAWNAQTGEHDHLPTEAQIIAEYFKLTGGEDTGLVEADVLKTWHGPGLGLFGGQIAGYAPITPSDTLAVKQAIAFYGGAYLGIVVGQPQQEQFQRGEPWAWVEGQEEDGHCVVALAYKPDGSLVCATWGGLATLTPQYLARGMEEAWAILSHQMVQARGDYLGVNIEALRADLARV
jgi:hypothetical protein